MTRTAPSDPGYRGWWSSPPAPAGWAPDPSGRHCARYWDGARWTRWVADGGATDHDPKPDHLDFLTPAVTFDRSGHRQTRRHAVGALILGFAGVGLGSIALLVGAMIRMPAPDDDLWMVSGAMAFLLVVVLALLAFAIGVAALVTGSAHRSALRRAHAATAFDRVPSILGLVTIVLAVAAVITFMMRG